MAYFVFNGVKLECTMGETESFLEVLDPNGEGFLCGDKAANVKDCKPLINIQPFGRCKSLLNPSVNAATQINYGVLQPMPCVIPQILGDKWENWEESNMYIRGHPVLLNCATIDCVFQGIINITENIQEGVKTGILGLDKDVRDDSDFNRDLGPGTTYINDKGEILYQKNDGRSGNILIVFNKDIPLLTLKLRKAKMMGNLNEPNNGDFSGVGMTGGQYTQYWNGWGGDYPLTFQSGYRKGYHDDTTVLEAPLITTIAYQRGGHGAVNMTSATECELDGIRFGKDHKGRGLIDAYNPTARVTGPPILNI
jgi:hypothetical protein